MAKEEATLLIRIKEKGAKTLGKIGDSLKSIGKVALGAVAGLTAMAAAALKLANDASEFDAVSKSFRNLALSQGQDADMMLAKMRELSAGTISDMKLMQKANQALLLGLPVDRFGDMLEIARSSAKATGESMDFMLNSIVTGLGRGSKLVLDNLGIVFKAEDAYKEYAESLGRTAESLSEAEKKQAFINKALEVGKANAEAAGDSQLTFSESIQIVIAKIENITMAIGGNLIPILSQLTGSVGDTLTAFEEWASSTSATEFFKTINQGIAFTINRLALWGHLMKKAATFSFSEMKDLKKEANEDLLAQMEDIEDRFRQRSVDKTKESEEAKKIAKIRALEQVRAAETEAAERKYEKDLEQHELQMEFLNATESEKLQLRKQFLQQHLNNDKIGAAKQAEIKKKLARTELEIDQQRTRDRKDTFATIATLQSSNNKHLAALGKAAAITQIAIDGPQAITKALAAFPPPFNFVAADLVGTALAAQAARVAGVQLAEGGIISPTPGGTPAVIGEGGRSEAVIPLPDDFDPDEGLGRGGPAVTINFSGPLMGDQSQAREFARAVDRELLELRRANESVAFDEGVI